MGVFENDRKICSESTNQHLFLEAEDFSPAFFLVEK